MKSIFLLPFLLTISLFSQDNTWVEIVTDKVQIDARGYRVWVADVNGDNYPDLLWGGDVGGVRNHVYLMINEQDPNSSNPTDRVFADVSQSSGIQTSRNPENTNRITDVVALGDVDNDGDLDIVTSIYTHRLQNYGSNDPGDRTELLINDGNGNFTLFEDSGLNELVFDASIEAGLTNVSSICFIDYNKDGNLDIYFGTWFTNYVGSTADRFMPNILVKGNGDGTFEKVQDLGVSEPLYGATVFDWNNDGWQDIATSSYCRTQSRLYMNMGGEFIDATELSNYNTQRTGGDNGQNLCQWEAIPCDYDNDGDLDLLEVKVHGGYNSGEGRTTITTNGGDENDYILNWKLNAINRIVNPQSHIGDMGGCFIDWDNDGLQDMMIGQDGYLQGNPPGGVRLFFLNQTPENSFEEVTFNLDILPQMEESHSMEPADFDLDGDLDLFITSTHKDTIIEDGEQKIESYKRVELLENKVGNQNYWLAVKPKLSDGDVYSGTRITVFRGDEVHLREINQGGGHFGYQSPETQYFGLGNSARVDSIKIYFNGKNSRELTYYDINVNRALEISDNSIEPLNYNYDNKANGFISVRSSNDFESIDLNTSKSKAITIYNKSQSDFTIENINLNDSTGTFEIELPSLPINIMAGESLSFDLTFTPNERLHYGCNIDIISNATNSKANLNEYKIEAFGRGFEEKPIAEIANSNILFEPIFIDSVSYGQLEIFNTGELPLNIIDIELSGSEYFEFEELFDGIIEPDTGVGLSIIFNPQELGEFEGKVTILSDGYLSDSLVVNISGICNGPLPDPKIVGFTIINYDNIYVGESDTKIIEIENSGNGSFNIYNAAFEGGDDAFSVENDFPILIGPNTSQEVEVKFSPLEAISYSSRITFDANVENDLQALLLGGGTIASVSKLNDGSEIEMEINPMPANSSSKLKINTLSKSKLFGDIFVFDYSGKEVAQLLNLQINNGETITDMNLSNLQTGKYLILLKTNQGNLWKDIIVE
jgi:hypothetical protein